MRGLFGDVPEPWTSPGDDAPVTEPHAVVPQAVAEPTRPARRLARGTEADLLADTDDLDERTRGRGPVRRPTPPWCAA
jgi:hypothetical protein